MSEGTLRRGVFIFSAEALVQTLTFLDGKNRVRVTGLPRDARVIGARTEHWGDERIELLIESDELPETLEGQRFPDIIVTFELCP